MTAATLFNSVSAVKHLLSRINDTADILIQSNDVEAKDAAQEAITDLQAVQLNLTGILQKVFLFPHNLCQTILEFWHGTISVYYYDVLVLLNFCTEAW